MHDWLRGALTMAFIQQRAEGAREERAKFPNPCYSQDALDMEVVLSCAAPTLYVYSITAAFVSAWVGGGLIGFHGMKLLFG